MVFTLIQKLQRKPEFVRKQVAFFVSGIIVLVIIAFWLDTFDARVGQTVQSTDEPSVSNNLAPLNLLKEQFGDMRELFSDPPL